MASLEENYHFWNNVYDWSRYGGDEWSARWGGPDIQWNWTLRPRIRRFLPATTILEIGPGFGRWTHFLLDHCSKLVVVDLAERCIHACKQRFAGSDKLVYRVNDGRSLDGVEDDSVDFVFSFESLVHAEEDVIEAYLKALARVLRPGGGGFLHHSNLAAYREYFRFTALIPRAARRRLKKAGLLDFNEWRAPSMSARRFQELSSAAGLACVSQELVNWGGRRMIDCLSVIVKEPQNEPCRVVENSRFIDRAFWLQRLSALYGRGVPW